MKHNKQNKVETFKYNPNDSYNNLNKGYKLTWYY